MGVAERVESDEDIEDAVIGGDIVASKIFFAITRTGYVSSSILLVKNGLDTLLVNETSCTCTVIPPHG